MGNALKEVGRLDEAIACYRRALELRPEYGEVHGNLGAVLIDQGKFAEAAVACRRALELKPDYVEGHVNLGNALKDQGRPEEAIACYRRRWNSIPHSPAHTTTWVLPGRRSATWRPRRPATVLPCGSTPAWSSPITSWRPCWAESSPRTTWPRNGDCSRQGTLADEQRLYLHFGLARVFDDRGEYVEAARHMERGNALQLAWWRRRGRQYDPREHTVLIDRLIQACTPDFFQRIRGFGLLSEAPVFIVGLPRSGTTLVEQIMASHSHVFGAGETQLVGETMNELGNSAVDAIEGLVRVDRETVQWLASRHLEKLRTLAPAAERIVDKMPDNYMLLGPLACLFPRAKFIHCRRDLRDVALSCWMTRFEGIRWANDPQHIAARFRDYARVMGHWREVLPVPLLEVDYEETVGDLEGVARRLVAFCGMEWEPGCLEFHRAKRLVTTASSVQVRQPLYATSVGRWKHYEQPLAVPLLGALEWAVQGMQSGEPAAGA